MGWLEGWKFRRKVAFSVTNIPPGGELGIKSDFVPYYGAVERRRILNWRADLLFEYESGYPIGSTAFTLLDGITRVAGFVHTADSAGRSSDEPAMVYDPTMDMYIEVTAPLINNLTTVIDTADGKKVRLTGPLELYMYYGKVGSEASQYQCGDQYDFCDDFSGGSIDTNRWTIYEGNGSIELIAGTISNIVRMTHPYYSTQLKPYMHSKDMFGPGRTITFRIKRNTNANGNDAYFGFSNTLTPWSGDQSILFRMYENKFSLLVRTGGLVDEIDVTNAFSLTKEQWITATLTWASDGTVDLDIEGQFAARSSIEIVDDDLFIAFLTKQVYNRSDNVTDLYFVGMKEIDFVLEDTDIEIEVNPTGEVEIDRRGRTMEAALEDIVVEKGAVFKDKFVWRDANGDRVDLTGASAKGQIRNLRDGDTLLATFDITLGDALGTIEYSLDADVTKALSFDRAFYDILVSPSGAADPAIATDSIRIKEGSVILSKGVTA